MIFFQKADCKTAPLLFVVQCTCREKAGAVLPASANDEDQESYQPRRRSIPRDANAQNIGRQPQRTLPTELPSADDFGYYVTFDCRAYFILNVYLASDANLLVTCVFRITNYRRG